LLRLLKKLHMQGPSYIGERGMRRTLLVRRVCRDADNKADGLFQQPILADDLVELENGKEHREDYEAHHKAHDKDKDGLEEAE